MRSVASMKVVFFGESTKRQKLIQVLRGRWPDLEPMIAKTVDEGLDLIRNADPALAFIFEDLPDGDVSTAISQIRSGHDIPLMAVLEDREPRSVFWNIELGADDCVVFPLNPSLLLARVTSLLRLVARMTHRGGDKTIKVGDLTIHQASCDVFLRSRRLDLSPTEFKLLTYLAENSGTTLTSEQVGRQMWPRKGEVEPAYKKYVQRLRAKLGDNARNPVWIKTVRGVGYQLTTASGTRQTMQFGSLPRTTGGRVHCEHSTLAEIGRIIGSSLDVDKVYDDFAVNVRTLIPFEGIAINLTEPESGTLTTRYARGVAVAERLQGDTYPLQGTISEKVIGQARPILLNTPDEDELAYEHPGSLPLFRAGYRAFLTVPITFGDAAIGTLSMPSLNRGVYGERHLEVAQRVAAQIAGAVASSQRIQQHLRMEESLRERIGTLERDNAANPSYIQL